MTDHGEIDHVSKFEIQYFLRKFIGKWKYLNLPLVDALKLEKEIQGEFMGVNKIISSPLTWKVLNND